MGKISREDFLVRILGKQTEDKMCGNIFVSVCWSAFSCLGCRGATLSSESSRRRETGTSPGLEPVSLPSDLVELPFEVPRFLLEPRGWLTTTSLGMGVVSPSTQHIPTTVILCMRTEYKMCGNVFVSVCLSAFSCLGCRRATLGRQSSRRRETSTSPGLEPVSLPLRPRRTPL